MDREMSERIYKIKAICILFAISMHMTSKNENCHYIMKAIGISAVPMFYFLSGYFYNYNKSLREIIVGTLEKICIPWWIWGTITYFLGTCISARVFLFKDLVLWIFGKGTWYYYLTVLMILYIIFKYFNSLKFCVICICFNFISYLVYSYKILGQVEFEFYYLNIFNWIGFFAFGIMAKKLNLLNKILQICDNNKKWILILFLIVFIFRVKLYANTGYIGRGAFIGEILGGMLLVILSKYLKSNKYIYRQRNFNNIFNTYANNRNYQYSFT